jgi:SAM-dependent methyltransferase
MKDGADAFGMALLDWARGGTDLEILERDDGFVDTGAGPEVYMAPLPEWPSVERRAIRRARGRVLDVGCGAGRVALHLQDSGFDVSAIDHSPLAVKACRVRGLHRVRVMSIDDLAGAVSRFDTLVLFGNNFGMFGDPDRVRLLLTAWARDASRGTRILAESTNPYRGEPAVPPVHRAYQRHNRERGRLPGQSRLRVRYRDAATPWFDWLIVSPAEMRRLLRGTGWEISRVFQTSTSPLYVAELQLTH